MHFYSLLLLLIVHQAHSSIRFSIAPSTLVDPEYFYDGKVQTWRDKFMNALNQNSNSRMLSAASAKIEETASNCIEALDLLPTEKQFGEFERCATRMATEYGKAVLDHQEEFYREDLRKHLHRALAPVEKEAVMAARKIADDQMEEVLKNSDEDILTAAMEPIFVQFAKVMLTMRKELYNPLDCTNLAAIERESFQAAEEAYEKTKPLMLEHFQSWLVGQHELYRASLYEPGNKLRDAKILLESVLVGAENLYKTEFEPLLNCRWLFSTLREHACNINFGWMTEAQPMRTDNPNLLLHFPSPLAESITELFEKLKQAITEHYDVEPVQVLNVYLPLIEEFRPTFVEFLASPKGAADAAFQHVANAIGAAKLARCNDCLSPGFERVFKDERARFNEPLDRMMRTMFAWSDHVEHSGNILSRSGRAQAIFKKRLERIVRFLAEFRHSKEFLRGFSEIVYRRGKDDWYK